jgi:23S rRNA (adenine2503-C2)-methyltransferase
VIRPTRGGLSDTRLVAGAPHRHAARVSPKPLPALDPATPALLLDHSREALRARFLAQGTPAHWADEVFSLLYREGVSDLANDARIPRKLRHKLASGWSSRALELQSLQRSTDGTRKLVLACADGELIEAVLIPEPKRTTLCVSTQVGCALACSFCATGYLGFKRNLSPGEITDQVLRAREALDPGEELSNVVFMGMGEPLQNLPAVSEALRIMTDRKGLALAPRRITVSTSGLIHKIPALLDVAPINLAISLHATTDAVRDELVPLNRRFPLAELLAALRAEDRITTKRPVLFEYTLMKGINDSLEDARRLPQLLAGIPARLNLIPMNPHADAPQRPPSQEVCDAFAAEAHAGGLRVTLRRNRGRDIDAACGQLARRQV